MRRGGWCLEEHFPLERILDVGTGPGRMAYVLARAGYNITTIDVSEEILEVARIYALKHRVLDRISFLKMDAQNMEFESGSFKTVVCVNLLHEVDNPEKVICEILRVCSQGGKFVVADLNRKGIEIVDKVHKIDNEVHQGKYLDLDKTVGLFLAGKNIPFQRFEDECLTTLVAKKSKGSETG